MTVTQKPLGGLTTTEIPSHLLGDLTILIYFVCFVLAPLSDGNEEKKVAQIAVGAWTNLIFFPEFQ